MPVRSGKKLPCGRPFPEDLGKAPNEIKGEKVWIGQLEKYLVKEGLKNSDQRLKIAELILTEKEHFSAQEIVNKVRGKFPDIGAATVYRNIKTLCDAKILRESLSDAEGRTVYERFEEAHHDHIVCLDCGEIFEFNDEKIEELQDVLCEKLKFQPLRHRHVIFGNCQFKGAK